jgi:hypothetical protein
MCGLRRFWATWPICGPDLAHVWPSATSDSAQLTIGFMAHETDYRVSVLARPRKTVLTGSISQRGQRRPRVPASQRTPSTSMRRTRSALARLPPCGLAASRPAEALRPARASSRPNATCAPPWRYQPTSCTSLCCCAGMTVRIIGVKLGHATLPCLSGPNSSAVL